ncbi:MAG: mycothiol conjugate amidase Mca [Acidimicrobiia bacterium]|nr:mycothiol conjugate amidase Mca [Acidimicrobiia bacterium]
MHSDLRLLTVHAHPDDEASKGAGTIAKYSADGVRCVLVCCTGGEAGDILNEAMNTQENRDNIAAVRRAELDRSAEILGYQRVAMLGYRDSGMPDMPENAHPDAFANAPLDEAVERLVRIIREERPQVIVTYSDHQTGYLHPDHLRVNEISIPAFHAAGDPDAYPDAGEPWTPSKMYYTAWSKERMMLTHEKCLEMNGESPFEERFFNREDEDHLITTKVDVEKYWDARCDALIAHATQVDPNHSVWFPLPRPIAAAVYPWDDYELAMATFEAVTPEDDLFAGLRNEVSL